MNRSLGDLTSTSHHHHHHHQPDSAHQSYVTVIPVEFSSARMPSGHSGYMDDRYTRGEYMQDRLPTDYLMRDYKKVSRYEELRFYGGQGGSGAPCSQRHPVAASAFDVGGTAGRRRFEQLDPRVPAACYPMGTSTLGRRRPNHESTKPPRDPLDLGGHYRAGSHHQPSSLSHATSGHHMPSATSHYQSHGYRPQRQPQAAPSTQPHLLTSNQRYEPHQQHPPPLVTRYEPLKQSQSQQRYYDKSNYSELIKDKRDNSRSPYGDRCHQVRETHSEPSIQGLHLHLHGGRGTPPSSGFPPPPPPPVSSGPPTMTASQILPPPAGYQNQPASKRQQALSHSQLYAQTVQQQQQAGPIPGKQTAARAPTPVRRVKKRVAPVEVCVFLMTQQAVRLECEDSRELTTAHLLQTVLEEEEIGLPPAASQVFGIWMVSPLLEIQLKAHHQPLAVRRAWSALLNKYSSGDPDQIAQDEPIISFQRSVFFSKRDEMRLRDVRVMELLYEEAKYNILEGRYPCESADYDMLAGLQARLELGAYDPEVHTPDFFKPHLVEYLPDHMVTQQWTLASVIGGKSSAESRIIDQYRSIPNGATRRKLVRKYLEFCWSLPYYGSAFFDGQVESPAKSIISLIYRPDTPVLVTINGQGVYVIDKLNRTVLLGLSYDELAWDFARPCQESVPDCLPCIFLQFQGTEYGRCVYNVLQIFSKQSPLMDALITSSVEEAKQRAVLFGDDVDGGQLDGLNDVDEVLVPLTTVSRRQAHNSCLGNKLQRLTLATFSEDGDCIRKMGSWSFSK